MSPRSRNTRNGRVRRRVHLPPVEDASGGWQLKHSPYTVEGEIEGFARLATGARRSHGRARRLFGFAVLLVFGIPLVIGVVSLFRTVLDATF